MGWSALQGGEELCWSKLGRGCTWCMSMAHDGYIWLRARLHPAPNIIQSLPEPGRAWATSWALHPAACY